jgi:hypothetical protein
MTCNAEAKATLVEIITSKYGRLPLKSVIPVLARELDLTERRVRGIYNGEARRIEAHEIDRIRAAAMRKQVNPATIEERLDRLEATVFGS